MLRTSKALSNPKRAMTQHMNPSGLEITPLIDQFLITCWWRRSLPRHPRILQPRLLRYVEFLDQNGRGAVSAEDTPRCAETPDQPAHEGLGARSRARHLVSLRGFYRFLVQEKILALDPAKLVDIPKTSLKLPDVLRVDEVQRLLNSPDTRTHQGIRDAAMLEVLYAAGLRVSSSLLKIQDVHLDAASCGCSARARRSGLCPWPVCL